MVYKNIKRIRDDNGLTQQEMADELNIRLTTYRSYETGTREPNIEFLMTFADKFNVTVDYILDHRVDSNILTDDESKHLEKYRLLDKYGKKAVDDLTDTEYERISERGHTDKAEYIAVRFNDCPVSAGTGDLLDDYEHWDTVLVPLTPESRKADFILRVDGDSMESMFYDGDLVLVHKQEVVECGEIGIFSVGGSGFIKKLGKNVLISLNKKYPDIPLDSESRCFGKVLGITNIVYDE